jgi:hypothetical protein
MLIAVKNPAAPPPIIMMSYFEFNGFVFANIGVNFQFKQKDPLFKTTGLLKKINQL